MTHEDNDKRLQAAAKELAKAASLHGSIESNKQIVEAFRDMKRQTQANLDEIASEIRKQKTVVDAIRDVKRQMQANSHKIAWEIKKQNLSWAIENVKLVRFRYYNGHRNGYHNGHYNAAYHNSDNLLQEILMSFRSKRGHQLPKRARLPKAYVTHETSEKAFRDKLVRQIEVLTGEKPVIKSWKSCYAIYMP